MPRLAPGTPRAGPPRVPPELVQAILSGRARRPDSNHERPQPTRHQRGREHRRPQPTESEPTHLSPSSRLNAAPILPRNRSRT